ncbi:dihydroorotase [Dimargaris cristalligena]|uniref:dihydroorotase n=1 Tax=Dimargaris cristalligena TaxID=215637 RepID=A0A4P9ZWC1_9FUNG|nr:dihydroorotase [Dimargaris cristalligena]|eukprot:RKP37917.1 dihydroorotase [Dimargaris cristalligena]
MASTTPITLRLPYGSDMHVHLRQGDLMEMVTPKIVQGGISTVFVMPNLQPPITSVQQALAYQEKLETLAPEVTFLMSLYLCPELTPDEIRLAAQAGIVGVKSYPRGVTTNSEAGIESYTTYYPVFAAMQEVGMVLNLHGEVPSDRDHDICVLNAEAKFLTHLQAIHQAFPDLWIVLEHATTREAVDMVKSLGPTVGCTITVHHLELVVDDWAGFHHHFCKPVAKFPHDRAALREVIREGHPRFFLGSDSAPHPRHAKENAQTCAGVFTTPLVMPYLATILDSFGALDRLRGFACDFGRQFYGLPPHPIDLPLDYPSIQLARRPAIQDPTDSVNNATYVVPFWAGHTLEWRLSL